MGLQVYPVSVGLLTCYIINDGNFETTIPDIIGEFRDVPMEVATQAFADFPLEAAYLAQNSLYVAVNGQRVLVDVGHGSTRHENHNWLRSGLASIGVKTEDIDIIVITHCHADHINGLANDDGALNFPNARYFIGRIDYEYWTDPANAEEFGAERVENLRRRLEPIREKLTLVEVGDTITAGVSVTAAYGHTPGHLAVIVESDGAKIIHLGDAFISPIQVANPDWKMRPDKLPELAAQTRYAIYNKWSDETLLVVTHFWFPGLGHIVRKGEGYAWQPV